MRVQIVDPPAYTPPYDRSLARRPGRGGRRGRAGDEPVRARRGARAGRAIEVREAFYRRLRRDGAPQGGPASRRALEHVRDMLRFRRAGARRRRRPLPVADGAVARLAPAAAGAPAPADPARLAAPGGLGRATEPRPAAAVRLDGRRRRALGLRRRAPDRRRRPAGRAGPRDPARGLRLPHPAARPGAAPGRARRRRGPGGARLRPRAPLQGHRPADRGDARARRARSCGSSAARWASTSTSCASAPRGSAVRARFVSRFVADREIPAIFERADVVALPYRDAEQSGVLYTALAFGKPIVVSDAGGFPEVVAHGAARMVSAGEVDELAAALGELLGRSGRARAARDRRRRRGARRLLLGAGRRPPPRPLPGAARRLGAARSRSSSGSPSACSSTRSSATRCCSRRSPPCSASAGRRRRAAGDATADASR